MHSYIKSDNYCVHCLIILVISVHQVMIPYLESHLNLIQIPDISDGTDVVVGYVDYDITK